MAAVASGKSENISCGISENIGGGKRENGVVASGQRNEIGLLPLPYINLSYPISTYLNSSKPILPHETYTPPHVILSVSEESPRGMIWLNECSITQTYLHILTKMYNFVSVQKRRILCDDLSISPS